MPKYLGQHVQRYPVDPLKTQDPLFRHGDDEQLLNEIKIGIRNSSNTPAHMYMRISR